MALWTPAELGSTVIVADYDTRTGVTVVDNKVSQHDDISGNNRHAVQATAANRLDYLASDSLANNFPSAKNTLSTGSKGLITPSFSTKNCYIVCYYKDGLDTTFDTFDTLFSGTGSFGKRFFQGQQNASTVYQGDGNALNDLTFKNGSTVSSNTGITPLPLSILKLKSNTLVTDAFRLMFNNAYANRGWLGGYVRFIFTDGSEALADEQKIEGYLADQYALQANLPANHPFKNVPPQTYTNLWSPTEITSSLWLDASDATTITEVSGAVSQWDDKSGNNNHAVQSNSSRRPTYVNTGSDAYTDHSAGGLTRFDLTTHITNCRTLFVVYSDYTNTTQYSPLLGSGVSYDMLGGTGGKLFESGFTDAGLKQNQRENGSVIVWSDMLRSTSQTIVCLSSTSSSVSIENLSTDRDITGRVFNGRYRQIILFTYAVSLEDIQKLEGWAAHEYVLQGNLPSGHPYRDVPPLLASSGALLQIMLSSNQFNGGMS